MTDRSMLEIEEMKGAKYINPYTDFGFKKERQDYEDSLKIYRDMKNVLDTAELRGLEKGLEKGRKEGLEKGLEKGRKEGIEQGTFKERRKNAKAMKALGLPLETIAKVTGMSADDIAKL